MRRLLLLALLAGCSRPAETSAFQFRVAAAGDLAPLGPHPIESASSFAQDWVYEPLVHLQADGSTKPALAVHLERLDPKSLRAWIRPGATFSDGTPVSAQDVVESLRSFNLDAHEEEGAIRIESGVVLPEAVLGRLEIYKPSAAGPLGSGPFSVVEQDRSHILLRRNARVPEHIDEIVIRSFETPREAFLRTLAGDADAYPLIDPRQIEFFEGVPRFKVIRAPSVNAIAVAFSSKRLDRDTRLGLLATLRGPELARMAYPDGCSRISWEPTSLPSLAPGRPLRVSAVLNAGSPVERFALAVQRALGSRGGEIEDLSFADHARRIEDGNFDLSIWMAIVWPHSDMVMRWHTNSSLSGRWYSNPKVDAAVDSGDWERAMRELMDDPPVDYICLPDRVAIVDARIKNARIGPYGFFETLPDWEIAR